MAAKCFIYLLKLEQDKYYIGRTNNPERRMLEHIESNGAGAYWTTMYKPVKLTIIKRNADPFDEDKYVKLYMSKKGIDNVRGGSYSASVLSPQTVRQLLNEIQNATDRCFKCNQAGHFSKDCIEEKKVTVANTPGVTSKSLAVKKCSICHQGGHNKRTCPRVTKRDTKDVKEKVTGK